MSWSVVPPGLTDVVSYSDSYQHIVQSETLFCPGDPPWTPDATIPLITMNGGATWDDSYAADHISAFMGYHLVQIYIGHSAGGGGITGGWHDCADYHSHPIYDASFSSVAITGGPSSELRAIDTGDLRPTLDPFSASNTPRIDSYFMRPTAHTWDGQDPANDANRSCWLPSEVAGLIGTVRLALGLVEGATLDFYFGTGIRALQVNSGRPPDTTDPIICFV